VSRLEPVTARERFLLARQIEDAAQELGVVLVDGQEILLVCCHVASFTPPTNRSSLQGRLQDVAAQILIFAERRESLTYERGIDTERSRICFRYLEQ